ncbi:hypothetical protein IZU89_01295 [Cellulophaga lytica]|uniref:Membrane-bound metal-dependent hydrolase n=2 Tax=Cellulophaga TaxID=104264 RepID=F0RH50_CELLC|nr:MULTISPECIES: DUF6122 family protein [Cellulophaga]ADY28088.1 hypothetical protein Celly_0253 [Cellulophaga lytica DSM 7489]AIM59163.1 membrane protein [Cellulophaga lytica]EWH14244.1 hypothetical protein KLA_06222 [Cellulophaga geojensis KL-A]MDO6855162.1 DUF6122 family protein [Cellulophaga lytica]TVZ09342.1 hypothetical protein JM80_1867 [Cellulophaga sp. RHA_52]
MLRFCLHYGIHFIAPIVIGYFFYKEQRLRAIIILLAAILIDLDHLLATPIFEANRCSINFHPLHTYWAMGIYISLLFFKKTRIFGIALLLHMLADFVDCLFINS